MIDEELKDDIYDLTYYDRENMEMELVGCFCCENVYLSLSIKEWTADDCAICPKCGVDAVIPMMKSFQVLLKYFNKHQFGI